MKMHLKSRNPALNIPRRHESVATETIFSDTPAVDSGVEKLHVNVNILFNENLTTDLQISPNY